MARKKKYKQYTSKLGHKYVESGYWVEIRYPDPQKIFTCKICGYTFLNGWAESNTTEEYSCTEYLIKNIIE